MGQTRGLKCGWNIGNWPEESLPWLAWIVEIRLLAILLF